MPGRGIRLLVTGLLATCGAGMLTLTAMMNPTVARADGEDIGLVIGASGVPIPGALYVAAADGQYLTGMGTLFAGFAVAVIEHAVSEISADFSGLS